MLIIFYSRYPHCFLWRIYHILVYYILLTKIIGPNIEILEQFSMKCHKTKSKQYCSYYSDQSQHSKIVQWGNQNSKQLHATRVKCGKMHVCKFHYWFWFCFSSVENVVQVCWRVTKQSNAKAIQMQFTFSTELKKHSM